MHVLTSVDYAKMSDEDKAKEPIRAPDHDYGLSWIRREGKGRLFYEAHGHDERIYAMRPMLEHLLAGIQYALGDLKADDSPSAKSPMSDGDARGGSLRRQASRSSHIAHRASRIAPSIPPP